MYAVFITEGMILKSTCKLYLGNKQYYHFLQAGFLLGSFFDSKDGGFFLLECK
jgi:hypothetical protein